MSGTASNRGQALVAVALAQFMVTLDMTVVNVALPDMESGLGFDPAQLPWVVNIYALFFGGFLLLGGRAADLYGQRRILLSGTWAFALASLAGGLAQEPWQMIAARAVQGVGAAVMAPAALAVLTLTQREGEERTRALGVYAAVAAVGGGAGVLVGGLLTEYAGWRWVMLVNLPMALAVLLLALRSVPAGTFGNGRGRLDVIGAVLATGGVGLLILGMVRTDQLSWTSPTTILTLAVAVVLLVAFVLWEKYGPMTDPLIRLSLLTRRNVAGANLYMALLAAGQLAVFYFLSLYLQRILKLGPAEAGAAFLPLCVIAMIAIQVTTRVLRRQLVGTKTLLVPAGLIAAAGFAWCGMADASGSYLGDVLLPSVLAGLGVGIAFVPVTAAATVGLPPQEAGTASALLNASRQVGSALGLAVLVTVATTRTDHRLAAGVSPDTAAVEGYSLGFVLAGGFLLLAVLVAAFVLPRRPRPVAGQTPTAQQPGTGAPATIDGTGSGGTTSDITAGRMTPKS
ncbi:MFS transporter [Streptomyces leeuwenhoekii]|uniref:Cephamycin export protein CmcT n=1 Tax=Streptomyces leeuwenhoekii TaxID=1437453 RepID=A0A0F7VX88_STRLW|nr:MFS transporter [Streptomyces leeuwenhoekii]KMS78120.1 MFS transporter [Streptomyces leeuwenhoekii]CQR63023.1 Cephamycin export protein CmcT [Streptomyces leeuwenhoekii]